MKLIDINFFVNTEFDSLGVAVVAHKEALGYVDHIKDRVEIEVIKHIGRREEFVRDGVKYSSFIARKGFFSIPIQTLRYVRKQRPDVVIVQGLIFPIQVILLHFFGGTSCKVFVQHHKEGPFARKRIFQKIADRYIRGYLFTARGNAKEWLNKKVIGNAGKCHEIPEGSTAFVRLDKDLCKTKLGITGDHNFLYVGRLNTTKDPLTVLAGFARYAEHNTEARLYMIYQTDELLAAIRTVLESNAALRNAVHLVGKTDHDMLQYWYSAMDLFISGSHNEGSGYALIESMACGCIPVVTDIPPFRTLTGDGRYGLLFKAGDQDDLFEKLCSTGKIDRSVMEEGIIQYFDSELSFCAIADTLYAIVNLNKLE